MPFPFTSLISPVSVVWEAKENAQNGAHNNRANKKRQIAFFMGVSKISRAMRSVILLLATLPLLAQTPMDSGDAFTLKRWLTESVDKSETAFGNSMWAMGYVEGVAEASNGTLFCIPDNVRQAEFDAVIVKSLEDHPNRLHSSRVIVVAQALHDAYPCEKKGR